MNTNTLSIVKNAITNLYWDGKGFNTNVNNAVPLTETQTMAVCYTYMNCIIETWTI